METSLKSIQDEINSTEKQVIEKTGKMMCDPENFEWMVGAQERITYAKNKVKQIESEGTVISDQPTQISPIEFFYNINTAKEWIEISKNFMEKDTLRSAGISCLEKFKEKADETLKETENQILLEKTMGYENTEEAEWYLEAAKTEFEKGWYIASIYDATSAKIRVKIGSSYSDKKLNEIYYDFNKTEIAPSDLLGTIFLENSHYNMYRAIKDDSQDQAVLAIQTISVSKEINGVYQDVRENMGKPIFNWSINWKLDIGSDDYVKILIVVVVVLVLYVLILSAKIVRLERKTGVRRRRRELR